MNDNEADGSEGSRHLGDITDLERIRAILESIAFNAWVTDAQGESTRTIVGRDAIFGSGTISIEERLSAIHPDDLATLGRAMTEARAHEAPFEVTVRGKQTVGGPWRHLLLQGQPLRDSDGRLREWIGATTDVTRRVEAEAMAEQRCEALIASQERLELAFRAAAMGVWDYDMASDVITWTPEAADILGLDRTWIERAELLRRINEDDLAAHRENIRRAIAERTSFRAELRMLRADGSERCFATLGQAHYDANGNPTSIVGTVQDISSAKLESAYLQAQSHILQQIAIGAPIDSITADLLALIESQLPNCAAALTIFGPSGGTIRTVAPRLAPEVLAQVEA
ncbi:MAG TPA: PAS domain-containing protein, partial [Planctomycetota bacterium]|nr:PAS domain-containing protein [Planctomycetota bacterium]